MHYAHAQLGQSTVFEAPEKAGGNHQEVKSVYIAK